MVVMVIMVINYYDPEIASGGAIYISGGIIVMVIIGIASVSQSVSE